MSSAPRTQTPLRAANASVGPLRGAPAAISLGAFVVFSLLPILPAAAWAPAVLLAWVLAAGALATRRVEALGVAATCALAPACGWLLERWLMWPLPYLVALGVWAAAVVALPVLRPSVRWLRRGRLGGREWLLVGGAAATSSAALVGWFVLLRPDVSDLRAKIPPGTPLWLLALGALGFSMLNAAVEEAIWRGVLLEGLLAALGPRPRWVLCAVVLQAFSFGLAHVHGFPRGGVGVGLAAIYGLMIGLIRLRADGMLAPWVAHVFADLTILGILAGLAA